MAPSPSRTDRNRHPVSVSSVLGRAGTRAVTSLGTPIEALIVNATAVTTWHDGRPVLVAVGGTPDQPVTFAIIDLADGAVLAQHRIPNSHRCHAVTALDRTVVIASWDGGNLYHYDLDAGTVVDLGAAGKGQWTAAATTAAGDRVFGGTFPGGHVFEYEPGHDIVDHGPIDPSSDFVRALAWDGRHLYVGTEPHARLFRLDPTTGARSQMLLPASAVNEVRIDDLSLRSGRLLVHLGPSQRELVLDLGAMRWCEPLPCPCAPGVTAADADGAVYVVATDGELLRFDPSANHTALVGWRAPAGAAQPQAGLHLVEFPSGPEVVGIGAHTRPWRWDPATGRGQPMPFDLPPIGVTIRSLDRGPGGRILIGGSVAPTTYAEWDPVRNAFDRPAGGPNVRIDAFAVIGETVLFGGYPGATVHAYDRTRPYAGPPDNPRLLFQLGESHHQGRIHALHVVGDDVYVGSTGGRSVPDGRLLRWSSRTGELADLGNPVPTQSVVSLTHTQRHGAVEHLVGGTSVQVDGAPVADRTASVFLADPRTGVVTWQGQPQPGAVSISDLTVLGDQVWGLTTLGHLFRFDPTTHVFHDLVKVGPAGGAWGMGSIIPRGPVLFGATGSGTVFAFDTRTHYVTYLGLGEHAVIGEDDALYWAWATQLFRLPLTEDGQPI